MPKTKPTIAAASCTGSGVSAETAAPDPEERVAATQDNGKCESAKLKPKPCDTGLRLAVSILNGFPLEVRFLRTRPNVNIDRVGRYMRVQPSVRAFRTGARRRAGPW